MLPLGTEATHSLYGPLTGHPKRHIREMEFPLLEGNAARTSTFNSLLLQAWSWSSRGRGAVSGPELKVAFPLVYPPSKVMAAGMSWTHLSRLGLEKRSPFWLISTLPPLNLHLRCQGSPNNKMWHL